MSVIPAVYNMKARQGSTFSKTLTVSVSNSPLNLAGSTVRMQIRPTVDTKNLILDLSTTNGLITKVDNLGKIVVSIPATTMERIPVGSHRYDIEVITSGGEVTAFLEGAFVVITQVTK